VSDVREWQLRAAKPEAVRRLARWMGIANLDDFEHESIAWLVAITIESQQWSPAMCA
jgi:hypothetical protein